MRLLTLAKKIAAFDPETAIEKSGGVRPDCLACGASYVLREGADPSPLCDPCAQEYVSDFARVIAKVDARSRRKP